jgi:hypothetical protein
MPDLLRAQPEQLGARLGFLAPRVLVRGPRGAAPSDTRRQAELERVIGGEPATQAGLARWAAADARVI